MLSAIPTEILQQIQGKVPCTIRNFFFSGGGCINHGGKLETSDGSYFLKWNDRFKYPGMFKAECDGLSLLQRSRSIRIPGVILSGETNTFQYLLLEFIDSKAKNKRYWIDFGLGLAKLHQNSWDNFGLGHQNYIGSLIQNNDPYKSWLKFFIQQRLEAQLVIGTLIDRDTRNKFEKLYAKLPSLLPDEKPALLHGDLWSGNLITDESGSPCLIDPAVYYSLPDRSCCVLWES
jgi:protein-ribulosamine 3-kinase